MSRDDNAGPSDEVLPSPGSIEIEDLADEHKSIVFELLRQFTRGMDLHKVALPSFVLEPRSMTERLSDFFGHPELIIHTALKDDPLDRFLDVVRFFISGWHVKPKGIKKPYNPVLGEFFRCRWTLPSGAKAIYICEQVAHHPPASAYCYRCPDHLLELSGDFRPRPKFLGNSVATVISGTSRIRFTNRDPSEVYVITFPTLYTKGILFGRVHTELLGKSQVTCLHTGLSCEIEFKSKGIFSGTWNSISASVRDSNGTQLAKLTGTWTGRVECELVSSGAKTVLDIPSLRICDKEVERDDAQEEFESRRLWTALTRDITLKTYDAATASKQEVEENSRRLERLRDEDGQSWGPRFFRQAGSDVQGGDMWELDVPIGATTSELEEKVFARAHDEVYSVFWLPRFNPGRSKSL